MSSEFIAVRTMLHDDFFGNAPEVLPPRVHAFFKHVPTEDLREGMENIVAYDARIPEPHSSGYTEERITRFLGTVTKIALDNNSIEVTSFVPREGQTESSHSFQTVASGNSSITFCAVEFFQEYQWVRVTDFPNKTVSEAFGNSLVRFDSMTDNQDTANDWCITNVINLDTKDSVTLEWAQVLMEEAAAWPFRKAMYLLTPQMEKPKREAEGIPPMPGEKPNPVPNPEGNPQESQGGKPDDDIPPMPGSSNSVTDKNRRGDVTDQIGKGWWGTSQGEGK